MAIAPISGLTTYSPVASVQPMNYAVENAAGFSDVYNGAAFFGFQSLQNGKSRSAKSPGIQYACDDDQQKQFQG